MIINLQPDLLCKFKKIAKLVVFATVT